MAKIIGADNFLAPGSQYGLPNAHRGDWSNFTTGSPPPANWESKALGDRDVLVTEFDPSFPPGQVKRWRFFVELNVDANATGKEVGVRMRAFNLRGFVDGEEIYAIRNGTGSVEAASAWKSPESGTTLQALDDDDTQLVTNAYKFDGSAEFTLVDYGIEYELVEETGGGGGGGSGTGNDYDIDQTVEAEIQAAGAASELDFYVSGRGFVCPPDPLSHELKATTSASEADNNNAARAYLAGSFTAPESAAYGSVSMWMRILNPGAALAPIQVRIHEDAGGVPGAELLFVGQIQGSRLSEESQELQVSTSQRLDYRRAVIEAEPLRYFRLHELVDLGSGILSTPDDVGNPLLSPLLALAASAPTPVAGLLANSDDGALEFDGSFDVCLFGGTLLTQRTESVAVSAVVKLNSADNGAIFYNGEYLTSQGFGLAVGGASPFQAGNNLLVVLNGSSGVVDTGVNLDPGTIYHLVLQHTGSRWECWVNGLLVWSATTTVNSYSSGTTLVGTAVRDSLLATGYLDATIDELAIFDHPLPALTIGSLSSIARLAENTDHKEGVSLVQGQTYWVSLYSQSIFFGVEYGTDGAHGSGEELAFAPVAGAGWDPGPGTWGGKITGGLHLRLGGVDVRGYGSRPGVMLRTIPDFVRFTIGEIAGVPYEEIDQDAFDAATNAIGRYGGLANGLGITFSEWVAKLAREGRAEVTRVDRNAGPLYRLFSAGESFTYPSAGRVLPPVPELAETLRSPQEIASRFRAFYAVDLSFEGGSTESAFARVLRVDPTQNDVADLGFPISTAGLAAIEAQGGKRTAAPYFLLFIRDDKTAADWLSAQVVIRTGKKSSVAGAWPAPDVALVECGDVVEVTPLNGAPALKCQVFETADDPFDPDRRLVLVEVP